jgi:predicted aconitase with swiveling domain
MTQTIVLTGIARSKGRAAGEAAVNHQRMGWGYNHVANETGVCIVPGSDLEGQSLKDRIVVYPTVLGSTVGSVSLYFKVKESHVGPAAILCREVHWIDIAGAIASDIPAVDTFDRDPVETIKNGDWIEVVADKIGEPATVTITRKE